MLLLFCVGGYSEETIDVFPDLTFKTDSPRLTMTLFKSGFFNFVQFLWILDERYVALIKLLVLPNSSNYKLCVSVTLGHGHNVILSVNVIGIF